VKYVLLRMHSCQRIDAKRMVRDNSVIIMMCRCVGMQGVHPPAANARLCRHKLATLERQMGVFIGCCS
jgi:hypothetical protein